MIEGFLGLSVAAFLAGLVRGFSGFGTAMVFLPIAGQILTPFQAVTAMIVMDAIGPLPNVPRALKVAHRYMMACVASSLTILLNHECGGPFPGLPVYQNDLGHSPD